MMTEATPIEAPLFENIPLQLARRPQWVCWRAELRDGKMTKVPYIAGSERRASSTDLMTWRTFDEAVAAYERAEPPYDGIGFVFSSGDAYCGIDLDHCRDPETGDIAPWAQEIIDAVQDAYIEASPSGSGVHVICEGTIRGGAVRSGDIEMYDRSRFFTITGAAL
jgi:primase-polymerase (primpol)-like protein